MDGKLGIRSGRHELWPGWRILIGWIVGYGEIFAMGVLYPLTQLCAIIFILAKTSHSCQNFFDDYLLLAKFCKVLPGINCLPNLSV